MRGECHLLFIFTAAALGKQKGDGRIKYWGIKPRFSPVTGLQFPVVTGCM